MMKNWKIPVASVQKFAPNEYISACEPMLLNCDLCADVVGEGKKYDRVHVDGFMEAMKVFFAKIPYDVHLKNENNFQKRRKEAKN